LVVLPRVGTGRRSVSTPGAAPGGRGSWQSAPGSPENRAAIEDEIALDRELNDRIRDLTVPGADPPYIDHEG
jgi:hypothetical protein